MDNRAVHAILSQLEEQAANLRDLRRDLDDKLADIHADVRETKAQTTRRISSSSRKQACREGGQRE